MKSINAIKEEILQTIDARISQRKVKIAKLAHEIEILQKMKENEEELNKLALAVGNRKSG